MSVRYFKLSFIVLTLAFLSACRGQPSEKPPIYIQYNMYWQEKFQSQDANPVFADGRSDRTPPEGTVARGKLERDTEYYHGVDADGEYIDQNPLELSRSFLERGKERYEIYCTPCHGGLGDGNSVTAQFGLVPIDLHAESVRNYPDGQIYSAIYNGIRQMPSYRHQINVEDRWAIVAYVRALQRSQLASEEDMRILNLEVEPAE